MSASNRLPLPVIRLFAAPDDPAAPSTTGTLSLTVSGQKVPFEITVPEGPVRLRELLPVLQGVAHVLIDAAVAHVEAEGKSISCRAGCGACCRQVVPVSESEAFALRLLVAAMPEPRRTEILARFAAALARFRETGLLDRLRDAVEKPGDRKQLGLEYFALGVPCPFLVEESCSIHPDRPLACREYLVTSPAVNCSTPSAETVNRVPTANDVSAVARALDRLASGSASGWMPLVLALDFAETHAEPPPDDTGPKLLYAAMKLLSASS
ncbi:MAG TPA: YkgJ family cysteine cluster protein [Fimbriiglobus sp.]